MTKKEFEKWKRLCSEKSDEVIRGYIFVHIDCPLLTPEEKKYKKPTLEFRLKGEKLIYDDYLQVVGIIVDFDSTDAENRYLVRQIHRKWIEKIHIFNIYGWEDISGKRDSKLEWIMKNLENDDSPI